jgi:predicted ArsR family transcriptional regulator
MDPAGPRDYRLLAAALTDSLARSADAVEHATASGRTMGAELGRARRDAAQDEPVGQLVDLLDELGFAPELQGDRIGLRHCPFLELAKVHSEVVCPVHLGLMQGAMQAWDAQIAVDALTPFAEPDLCVAQLRGARS